MQEAFSLVLRTRTNTSLTLVQYSPVLHGNACSKIYVSVMLSCILDQVCTHACSLTAGMASSIMVRCTFHCQTRVSLGHQPLTSHYTAYSTQTTMHHSSLVPRLHSPAFYRTAFIHGAIKSWEVESGNEATS